MERPSFEAWQLSKTSRRKYINYSIINIFVFFNELTTKMAAAVCLYRATCLLPAILAISLSDTGGGEGRARAVIATGATLPAPHAAWSILPALTQVLVE